MRRDRVEAGGRGAWRRALPVAFLVLSLLVAGLGALEAYRAERSHRQIATGVLTDYAEFAARSYQQRVESLLNANLANVFAVVRRNRAFRSGEATDECLAILSHRAGSAEACDCTTGVAGRHVFFTRLDRPENEARWAVGTEPDPTRESWIRAVREHARTRYRDGWAFGMTRAGPDGPLIAYARLVTLAGGASPQSDTLLYGFDIDPERLAMIYRGALTRGPLLPHTLVRDRPNTEVVRVEALDQAGQPLFASHQGVMSDFAADAVMPAHLGGGAVRASVLPEAADELIIGGLPENRTPLFLLIFGLASVLAGAAVVQLRREQELARVRQDFIASVSHELRTPLAQVRLFTETLTLGRTRCERERAWALENIDRETLRLSHLVENVLHFSRAERGVRNGDSEEVDLSEAIADGLRAFQPLVPADVSRFELDVPGALPARVHPGSFRQVMLNFLDNAVRHGARGQTVRITAHRSGERIRVGVEDEGDGVPPAERERIFEPFRRGDRAVGTVAAGSGIGLSVVREIAEAHHGRVWVEDAPSGGARFVLELPSANGAP